jgi:micrococcal nuclease
MTIRQKKYVWILIGVFAVSALFIKRLPFLMQILNANADATRQPIVKSHRLYRVAHVIDGDTLVLENGRHVRLIGVNTPEMEREKRPAQPYAKKAKEFTRKAVEGKRVTLATGDEFQDDRYGRILAYVFYNDTLVNLKIIQQGYGFAMTRYDHPLRDEFIVAEKQARKKQKGMWKDSANQSRVPGIDDRLKKRKKLFHISYKQADDYIGETVVVQGKIVETYHSGKAVFLNFGQNPEKGFYAVIFKNRFHRFPESPEKFYRFKTVRIKGKMKKYRNRPQIVVDSPDQIEIIR